jgi:hypothetical protein
MSARISTPLSTFARRTAARLAACGALASILAAGTASADSVSFQLTDGNLSAYNGPYASVTVDLTSSTTAIITFTSLPGSSSNCGSTGCYYLMGDGGSAAVNVNATSFSVSSISGANSLTGFTPGPYTTGSGNEDGLGNYNLRIDGFDGWSHSADSITFTLTDISGTWASAYDVLIANNKGYDAAIHFFPCIVSGNVCLSSSPGANKSANSNGGTGYAAGTAPAGPPPFPPPPVALVPIPAAAWLFGSGLIGLIVIARRRRP